MTRVTIAFIVIGLIIFTSLATFDYGQYMDKWGRVYAIWDKTAMVLLCWSAWQEKRDKEFKPIFWLLVLRVAWDGFSWGTGLNINNTKAVGTFFIIYSVYVLYKVITNVRN